MTRFQRRFRAGKRGSFLLLFGYTWLTIGYGLFSVPTTTTQRSGLSLLLGMASAAVLGTGWIVAGAIAMAIGIMSLITGRPGGLPGFLVLLAPPSLWAATYGVAAVTYQDARAWLSASVYLALAGTVVLVATWRNPTSSSADRT